MSSDSNEGRDPYIVVCIPAFNEAKNIGSVVRAATAYADKVIVCDDGSSDFTGKRAAEAGATVIKHLVNRGYGAAIKTLFHAAKKQGGDITITLDSDGQHNPDQIPLIIKPILEEGYDIVVGSRFLNGEDREKVPAYRSFGIRAITKLAQMTYHKNLTDAQSGFRAYSKNALSKIDLTEEGMAVSTEILMRAGQANLHIKEVPVSVRYDVEDASTHNPILHGVGIVLTIIKFLSIYHPLSFYGLPGIGFLIVAGFYVTWALDLFSATRYVSTNMILIAVGSAVIGVMLLLTAVILYTISALLREKVERKLGRITDAAAS
ncbi:MAG: glycosyltransferase family 2 protein [Nitrososphaerales archaeon]